MKIPNHREIKPFRPNGVKRSSRRPVGKNAVQNKSNILRDSGTECTRIPQAQSEGASLALNSSSETVGVLLLKSRLPIDDRSLTFFVHQYFPPANFFTVKIRVAESESEWCSFFPVTPAISDLLGLWSNHKAFENRGLFAKWLIQALRIEFSDDNNITNASFDEGLVESKCFKECRQFFEIMARRIQSFFVKNRKKLSGFSRKWKKQRIKRSKKQHRGKPSGHLIQATEGTETSSQIVGNEYKNSPSSPLASFIKKLAVIHEQRSSSGQYNCRPKRGPRALSAPQANARRPLRHNSTKQNVHSFFPSVELNQTLESQLEKDSESWGTMSFDPPSMIFASENDDNNGFNNTRDYFHQSILSGADAPNNKESDEDSDLLPVDDSLSLSFYACPSHDKVLHLAPPKTSHALSSNASIRVSPASNVGGTINLSTALDKLIIDQQLEREDPRDARDRRQEFIKHDVSYNINATRIQLFLKRMMRKKMLSRSCNDIRQNFSDATKVVDSKSVTAALNCALETGDISIAIAVLDRIFEIVNAYSASSALEYSIYFPRSLSQYSLLVRVINAFLSNSAVSKVGLGLLTVCFQKVSVSYEDLAEVMKSAGVCDVLFAILKRHMRHADISKDAARLMLLIYSSCSTHNINGGVVLRLLEVYCGSPDILLILLDVVVAICSNSPEACVEMDSCGIFDHIVNLLRKGYKNPEAISLFHKVFFDLAAIVPCDVLQRRFGSCQSFTVYTDCMVTNKQASVPFKMICNVIYGLVHKVGESILDNLVSEYFALAVKSVLGDKSSNSACIVALTLLLDKLQAYPSLTQMLESHDIALDYDKLSMTHADFSRDEGKLFTQSALSGEDDEEEATSASDRPDRVTAPSELEMRDTAQRHSSNIHLSSDAAIRRIQYTAMDRMTKIKRKKMFDEAKKKAFVLSKQISNCNFFSQIAESLQCSVELGDIDLCLITLRRIVTLIEESRANGHSSLVARTLVKNPKILLNTASSFLSIKSIQCCVWHIMGRLPFQFGMKSEVDLLLSTRIWTLVYWVVRRHLVDEEVVRVCMECSSTLTASNEILQERFGKNSGLRVLAAALTVHDESVPLMTFASKFVSHMCEASSSNRERCGLNGISNILVQFMIKNLHSEEAIGSVTDAIVSLCGEKKNANFKILMSRTHILLYLQILKNNLDSVPICNHICSMLTYLSTNALFSVGDELQQSAASSEITSMLSGLSANENANQNVLHTILLLVVHLLVAFPGLCGNFLNDGVLRTLNCILDSEAMAWQVPVLNASKMAKNTINTMRVAQNLSHAIEKPSEKRKKRQSTILLK